MSNLSEKNCPACGAGAPVGRIVTCSECSHRWMPGRAGDSLEIYTEEYSGYKEDPVFVRNLQRLIHNEFLTRKSAPAKVLDVGCGAGDFLVEAARSGYQATGIDVSEASAELCGRRGASATAGNYLKHPFKDKFDIITMWDVLEHLRDPAAFLDRSKELLAKDGFLFVKIPSFGPLSVNLSRHVERLQGLLLGAPDHVQYFNRNSLTLLMEHAGYSVEWIKVGSLRSRTSGGTLKSRVARRVGSLVSGISGDGNLCFVARPKGAL